MGKENFEHSGNTDAKAMESLEAYLEKRAKAQSQSYAEKKSAEDQRNALAKSRDSEEVARLLEAIHGQDARQKATKMAEDAGIEVLDSDLLEEDQEKAA